MFRKADQSSIYNFLLFPLTRRSISNPPRKSPNSPPNCNHAAPSNNHATSVQQPSSHHSKKNCITRPHEQSSISSNWPKNALSISLLKQTGIPLQSTSLHLPYTRKTTCNPRSTPWNLAHLASRISHLPSHIIALNTRTRHAVTINFIIRLYISSLIYVALFKKLEATEASNVHPTPARYMGILHLQGADCAKERLRYVIQEHASFVSSSRLRAGGEVQALKRMLLSLLLLLHP